MFHFELFPFPVLLPFPVNFLSNVLSFFLFYPLQIYHIPFHFLSNVLYFLSFFHFSFPFLFTLLSSPPSLLCSETRRSADGSSAGGSAERSGVRDEVSDRDGFYPSQTGRSQSPGEQQSGLQSVRLQTASGREDRGGVQHASECLTVMQHCSLQHLPMSSTSQWQSADFSKSQSTALSSSSNFYASILRMPQCFCDVQMNAEVRIQYCHTHRSTFLSFSFQKQLIACRK